MKRALVAVLVLVAVGCGSDDRQGAVGGAPLLTPSEAQDRDGRVAVQGFFWARPGDDDFRLCGAVLESFPPQCGEPSIRVTGVDVTTIAGIEFGQNVFWAEEVRARGELAEGTLDVEAIELNGIDPASGLAFRIVIPIEIPIGPIDFVALVTNTSSTTAELRFSDGQSADITLTDPEEPGFVYRWSDGRAFDQAVRTLEIAPGETVRFVLDEPDFNRESAVLDLEGRLTGSPAPPVVFGRLVVR